MARKTNRVGQGFSLFDLKDDIAQAVELLGGALNRQGVSVNQDSLFLMLQSVVKSVGDGYTGNYAGSQGYPSMSASDILNTPAPYSVAGDLLAIAYSHYSNGDKKQAVASTLTAMRSDDFGEIVAGLIAMNSRSEIQKRVEASEDDTDEDDDTEDSDEDEDDDTSDDTEDSDDETDDEDLTESELQALIDDDETDANSEEASNEEDSESATTVEASNRKSVKRIKANDTKPDDNTETDTDEETQDEEEGDNSVPMGKTSSTVTASHTAKVLANRLSMDGSRENRSKARDFMLKHPKIGAK